MSAIQRRGVLLDGIGSELVRASTGGVRKTLSKWLADLSASINLGDVASTFTSGDASPSVLNNSKFITAGSTTITNFDDGVEGQTITIYRGASDIDIADNATIDTIIAGNVTLSTARPSATFRLASGVWKQVEEAGALSTAMIPVVQAATLALALTAAGLGTGDSPQFAGINLGHASDTTITRVSAGKAAIEGDTIATWTAANTFGHTTGNTFNGRINIDPTYAVYDQFANVEAPMVNFGSSALTVAASKQLDLFRADNAITVGSAGIATFSTINLTSASGSHSTSNLYGLLHSITNAGPGTVKTLYGRAIGSGSSTGAIIGVLAAVTPGASTSLSASAQISINSTAKKVDYALWVSATNATDQVDYGLVAGTDVIINQSFVQACAVGAGNFLTLKNSTGASNLFVVSSTGAITTLSTLDLGNASDTTISRVSAGRIAVEGSNVLMASDLASNVATFLATPTSANLAAAVTNETGTGSLVFATSPTLVTPLLGTPTSGVLTNCTGYPASALASASGTYTPTLTGVANVASSAAYVCQYFRVGDVVTVTGKIDLDPTAGASTWTRLGISLPVASALANNNELAGTAVSYAGAANGYGALLGDAANDRAELSCFPIDTNNQSWFFTFSYRVL